MFAAGLQQAADGLTKLGTSAAAQEYGVVKVQIGTTDVEGAILTSGDIPTTATPRWSAAPCW